MQLDTQEQPPCPAAAGDAAANTAARLPSTAMWLRGVWCHSALQLTCHAPEDVLHGLGSQQPRAAVPHGHTGAEAEDADCRDEAAGDKEGLLLVSPAKPHGACRGASGLNLQKQTHSANYKHTPEHELVAHVAVWVQLRRLALGAGNAHP